MANITSPKIFKTIQVVLSICFMIFIVSCEDEDNDAINTNQVADKSGIFTGWLNYKSDGFDTLFQNLEFTVTKLSSNNYSITNQTVVDFSIEMRDNNGSLTLVNGADIGLTKGVGTLTNTDLTLSGEGLDDADEPFTFTYGGTKKTTGGGTTSNEYFIFDGTRYNAEASATNCRLESSPFPFYFIGMYTLTGGAGCIVRFKTTPVSGTYQVASYQTFIDEEIPDNACTVSTSEGFTASDYFSTGTKGTVVVTNTNGKISLRISNVGLAVGEGEPEKTLSDGVLICK